MVGKTAILHNAELRLFSKTFHDNYHLDAFRIPLSKERGIN